MLPRWSSWGSSARAAKDALGARGIAAECVFLVATKAGEVAGKDPPRRADFTLR